MRTVFHKDTGRYLGNIADARALNDLTLPLHLQGGHIAVPGAFNAAFWRDPGDGQVKAGSPFHVLPKALDADGLAAALVAKGVLLQADVDGAKK